MSSAFKTLAQVETLVRDFGWKIDLVVPLDLGFIDGMREYRITDEAGQFVFLGDVHRCGDFMLGVELGWRQCVNSRDSRPD